MVDNDCLEEMVKMATDFAMKNFDINGDGKISREEAEPMLQEVFADM